MYRRGIGKGELVQLGGVVFGLPSVEVNLEYPVLQVDLRYVSEVPVEDLLVVVVPELHHAVPFPEGVPSPRERVTVPVQGLLQGDVKARSTDDTPLHGREHLYGVSTDPVCSRQPPAHQVDDGLRHLLRILLPEEEEVRFSSVAQVRKSSGVYRMRTHHDAAGLCLPEYPRESDDRHRSGVDDIPEHVPGADARQLVYIPDKDEPHSVRHGFEQVVHQEDVNHRALVHYEGISREGVIGIALVSVLGVVLEHPVDGLGLHSRGLAHPLGRTSRGSCQKYLHAGGAQRTYDGFRGGRLPCTGTSGQHHHLRFQGQPHGLQLRLVIDNAFPTRQLGFILRKERAVPVSQGEKPPRHSAFGIMERRQIDGVPVGYHVTRSCHVCKHCSYGLLPDIKKFGGRP